MPRLGHRSLTANDAPVSEGRQRLRRHGGALRMFACLGIASWALLAPSVIPSAAEEATTAPTCTGCSRPNVVKHQSRSRGSARSSSRTRAQPVANRARLDNEGAWAGVSTGPCIMTWRWSIDISNGAISGAKATGQVARNGLAHGAMVVFGKTYKFVGRFNGTAAAGTWKSAECSGGWTAAKS